VDSGNDYVIQLKGNQKMLLEATIQYEQNHAPIDSYESTEINRGRKENRQYQLYHVYGPEFRKWKNLNAVVIINHTGIRKGKTYTHKRYYISSRKDHEAKYFAEGIRSHWFIENKLHWVKDCILNEDNSLVNGKCLAKNLSMLRTLAFNVFKLNKEFSIKKAIERYTNRMNACLELMQINQI